MSKVNAEYEMVPGKTGDFKKDGDTAEKDKAIEENVEVSSISDMLMLAERFDY